MRPHVTAAALLALSLPGCGGQSGSGTDPTPFRLTTHCGIDDVFFGNRYYEAVEPLSNGRGNPPEGWGDPYQDGTMHQVSPTEVEFRDHRGHRVIFRLRPDATAAKSPCD